MGSFPETKSQSIFTHVAGSFANSLQQRSLRNKKVQSHRTGLELQHSRRFLVLEYQWGGRDVM